MSAGRPHVAVVGSGGARGSEVELARELGRALAEGGAVVVCGGLGGVMEGACRGAREGGGTTVGILPGNARADANRYVEVAVATGMGEARNALIVRTADALVAVGGEFGTLSEIALALKAGKPAIGLSSWELAKGGAPVEGIVVAASPAEAAELALAGARTRLK